MGSPLKSWKTSASGTSLIFSSKRSLLLRKRMTEVSRNHLLLRMELNSRKASSKRFWRESNTNQLPSLSPSPLPKPHSPPSHLPAGQGHRPRGQQRTKWPSHLQSSGSTSFSPTSDLQHPQFCRNGKGQS